MYATAMTADIFKVTETSHAAYIGNVHKGPGLFSKVGEVQTVPSYTAKVANKFTVTISDFAQGIEISKNLFDDDIHGEYAAQVNDLAVMARRTQDANAFKIFRGAFSTTLTADGAALVGSHNLIGGGTTNNEIVTADVAGASSTALTTASFNVAMNRLATMKSHSGVPLQCVGNILLVPTTLFVQARQIATSALVPENGNNALNVYSMDYSIKVYQTVWLGTAEETQLTLDQILHGSYLMVQGTQFVDLLDKLFRHHFVIGQCLITGHTTIRLTSVKKYTFQTTLVSLVLKVQQRSIYQTLVGLVELVYTDSTQPMR